MQTQTDKVPAGKPRGKCHTLVRDIRVVSLYPLQGKKGKEGSNEAQMTTETEGAKHPGVWKRPWLSTAHSRGCNVAVPGLYDPSLQHTPPQGV